MRHFHPGLLSIIELHFEDVEAYLAEDFAPIASEEVRPLPSGLAYRRADQRKRFSEIQPISLAVMTCAASARRARFH
jgi:hypothetical protein